MNWEKKFLCGVCGLMTALSTSVPDKNIVNQAISLGQRVTSAIQQASTEAGVDFSYLLKKATQESSLNPNAKAQGSTATGLFQFVEQTWLHVVKAYGDKYGLGQVADRISVDSNGVAHVRDTQSKQAILNLRKDPKVSAEMAAELTNENRATLQQEVGGKIGPTELYLAHFLGASGASDFLQEMKANPNAKAADILPEVASANPHVFYDKSGQPRSLNQIYQHFASKFEGTTSTASASTAMQSNQAVVPVSLPSIDTVQNIRTLGGGSSLSNDNSGLLSSNANSLNSYRNGGSNSLIATMMLAQMNLTDMTAGSSVNLDYLYGQAKKQKDNTTSSDALSNNA